MELTPKKISEFQSLIYTYYKENKRDLPWRNTTNPYCILVSEVMLQQTQVSTVLKKYHLFLEKFPTIESLAQAPLKEVLSRWQGLGYNRRAIHLKKAAEEIVNAYQGKIPKTEKELRKIPGIGTATASSILAFAFNQNTVFVETNIRSVFIHIFLKNKEGISDSVILPLVEQTLDRNNPKEWYNALMDYGTFLKSQYSNPSKKSKHYKKQSTFKGSNRELRGVILKLLLQSSLSKEELINRLNDKRIELILEQLEKEGLIHYKGNRVSV